MEYKIAQLLIVGFEGAEITPGSAIIDDIRNSKLGGVILFDRFLAKKSAQNNIISHEQTRRLISDLQNEANGSLLIAVDQEGGKVNRFKSQRGFAETPAAAELARDKTITETQAAADQTARLLSALGINLNLAPVIDLNSCQENPIIGKYDRSFSADPDEVIRHAEAWIAAHKIHNIHTCVKHFPGHGSASVDSHLGFVDISNSWKKNELFPYQYLINHGLVDSVMTGHLYNGALDSVYPATLSYKTVTGILRNRLGFSGPVISDDMQMRAITSHYGLAEAVCRALAAGVDMLIFGNNLDYDPDIVTKVVKAVSEAVVSGTLTEERIEEAWRRVQLFKQSHLTPGQ